MKKILLFLLLFAGMANAQIVSIADPAFHAKLLALGVDTNADGAIQQNEALAVTSLDLTQSNIAVLDGIAAFTNLAELHCRFNLLSELNLAALSNLVTLDCSYNQITVLNVNGLPNLQNLNCAGNKLTSLNVLGLTNLISLDCPVNQLATLNVSGLNLQHLGFGYNPMASMAAVTGIPTNLESLSCNALGLTTLNVSAFPNLKRLDCIGNLFTSLNAITGLSANLEDLYCFNNQMTSLNLTGFPNLKRLYCHGNPLTAINVSGLVHLEELNCNQSNLTALNVSGLTALRLLACDYNQITALDLSGLTNLKNLSTHHNELTLNLTGLNSLELLVCSYNQIPGVDFSPLTNLASIYIYGGTGPAVLDLTGISTITELNVGSLGLTSINLTGLTNLKTLTAHDNALTSIDLSGLVNLESLTLRSNSLTSLDLTGLNNIKLLDCGGNGLTSLDVSGLPDLETLYANVNELTSLFLLLNPNLQTVSIGQNHLTDLNLMNSPNLKYLKCESNELTALNVYSNPKLNTLVASDNLINTLVLPPTSLNLLDLELNDNPLPNFDFSLYAELNRLDINNTGRTSIDVSNLTKLFVLSCIDNPIPSVDVTNNYKMSDLYCGSTALTQLFMKNGASENFGLAASPNLAYICTDESQTESVQNTVFATGNTTAVINSYCSFVPGGNYNTITGAMSFDANNNGCDANDIQQPNVKIKINDGTTTGDTFTNTTGNYSFYTLAGNFTITPEVENPTFFNFSPSNAAIPFLNDDNNVANQSFCITANGIHPDVEIVITPIGPAMPGFDAVYKIVCKNIGNQILSGNVVFNYNDAISDFVSASQAPDAAATGSLTWNYTNLMPFETRVYSVSLNLNSPVETPPVQINDLLGFSANANPIVGDENPSNNSYSLSQIVTGSYDPNAKTCLEGNVVSPEEIGNYLHYNIEFENLGTAEAINVVVKDVIDTTMFDINSLQILYASHEMRAAVHGNIVEFIFEDINLAPATGDPAVGGHGNILFKIKTQSNLEIGTEVSNKADIFFDYNAPVETNLARTTFESLGTPDHPTDQSIVIYPNPAHDQITINCVNMIKSIELFDVQGRILQTAIVNSNNSQLDISNKSNGIYFLMIITENGIKVEQIVKQ
jgi:uncharacterized repeat protein (TIGR01451 family)